VVWLDLRAPHRHFVVELLARAPMLLIGAHLPIRGVLYWELRNKANSMRTSALPLCLARLLLLYRLAILVAFRRFLGMGFVDCCSLRFDIYVRMHHFVRRYTYFPFRRFWGGRAARILATSFCCPAWYLRFLSSRCFPGGQRRCCGMPPCKSGLDLWVFPLLSRPPFLIGYFHCFFL
jgi:hypothetical protein